MGIRSEQRSRKRKEVIDAIVIRQRPVHLVAGIYRIRQRSIQKQTSLVKSLFCTRAMTATSLGFTESSSILLKSISYGRTVLMELLPIPSGDFLMGSVNDLFSETPAHAVRFPSGFLVGKYPVTQAQWQAVMGDNPSAFRDSPNHPVESISWDQAAEFCRRLGTQCGRRVRLPSEAEWEYACRAGTAGEFFFGRWGPFRDDSEVPLEVQRVLCGYAWFDLNSGDCTHPVGLKRPNPWGLHDMVGNVWEWCADVWHDSYAGAPQDAVPWLEGEGRQPRRCLRGGAWDMNAFRCRSPYRSYDHRELATNRFGFRVAVDAEPGAAPDPVGL